MNVPLVIWVKKKSIIPRIVFSKLCKNFRECFRRTGICFICSASAAALLQQLRADNFSQYLRIYGTCIWSCSLNLGPGGYLKFYVFKFTQGLSPLAETLVPCTSTCCNLVLSWPVPVVDLSWLASLRLFLLISLSTHSQQVISRSNPSPGAYNCHSISYFDWHSIKVIVIRSSRHKNFPEWITWRPKWWIKVYTEWRSQTAGVRDFWNSIEVRPFADLLLVVPLQVTTIQALQVQHHRSPNMRGHFRRHHPYSPSVFYLFWKFLVAQLRLSPVTRLYGQVQH